MTDRLKKTGIILAAIFFSCTLHTQTEKKGNQAFQIACTNAWLKNMSTIKDKINYNNFGEKYCDCAARQPIDTQTAIQKASQLCLSRVLLHDAMDTLEEEVGLGRVTDADITGYCKDRWNLIFPEQNDAEKKQTIAYCACAEPKLLELVQQVGNMTDKQYQNEVDNVAVMCSENALRSKSI